MGMQQPPPPPGPPHQVPPPNMPPVMNNHHGHDNGGGNGSVTSSGFRGPPPSMPPQSSSSGYHSGGGRSMMMAGSTQGPRASNRQPQMNGGSVTGGSKSGGSGNGSLSQTGGNGSPSQGPAMSHPVLDNLRSINEYNPKSFDMSPKNARFFVIKSFSEDDIHRSIKYEIWCSTDHGNKRLDAAYKAQNGAGPIFLFFSVNGSGHFCGMAEMLSGVDYSNTGSTVWVQDKFKGQFKVKWIYVKDVPNSQLRHIRLENNENKPVTNSRDTQEVPPEKGRAVLKIIHSYKHATSIFDDFIHYEKRQEEDEGRKPTGNKNPSQGRDRSRPHEGHYEAREERPRERRDGRRRDRDQEQPGPSEAREQNGEESHGHSREHSGDDRRKEEKGQGRSRGNPSKK